MLAVNREQSTFLMLQKYHMEWWKWMVEEEMKTNATVNKLYLYYPFHPQHCSDAVTIVSETMLLQRCHNVDNEIHTTSDFSSIATMLELT